MIESISRGVLGTPPEPVIGLTEGETRWRGHDNGRWGGDGDQDIVILPT
ncbi:hypothetical protein [Bradyrhizobium retamae]|nr:hypothetical protein [Bradyrhizobium retamae]